MSIQKTFQGSNEKLEDYQRTSKFQEDQLQQQSEWEVHEEEFESIEDYCYNVTRSAKWMESKQVMNGENNVQSGQSVWTNSLAKESYCPKMES